MERELGPKPETSTVSLNMNGPQSKTMPVTARQPGCWSLEVVRGRVVGQHYALDSGETIVGNSIKGEHGLDLVDQEGSSPRKMAGRHAALTCNGQELTIRDLETPGGTFVNQQRLLAGQTRRLVPGDVIQLGSVQVRVKRTVAVPASTPVAAPAKAAVPVAKAPAAVTVAAAPKPPATDVKPVASAPKPIASAAPSPTIPGRLTTPFSLAGGAQCRTWDDFLVLAAQSWPALRDELISGRLAEFLRRLNRPDLVPLAGSARSPDDQLDDWLARIPATGSSAPELDVHPEALLVQTKTGGGITQQTLRITNVGYRLLRCSARVEPPGMRWVRLRPEYDGRPFQTIDQTDLPIELELPETIDRPLVAQVVIESNGGTRRVGVRIERPAEQIVIPESAGGAAFASPLWREQLSRTVAKVGPGARIAIGCAGAVALRVLVMLLNGLPIGNAPANLMEPRLSSVAIMLVVAGMIAGLGLASRRGERRDFPAAAFAGGSLGLLAAAFWFAVLQSSERVLGSLASSIWSVGFVSGTLGALLALTSLFVFPYRSDEPEVAR
jgi:FHA domain